MKCSKAFLFMLLSAIWLFTCSACISSPKSGNAMDQDSMVEEGDKGTTNDVDEKTGNVITEEYEDGNSTVQITTIENTIITGEIVVVGDSMFSELVLVTEKGEHYTFRPEDKEEYWTMQGKTLSIRGKIEKRKITNNETGKILTKNWIYPRHK